MRVTVIVDGLGAQNDFEMYCLQSRYLGMGLAPGLLVDVEVAAHRCLPGIS
jgi:hypothetical protein